MFKEEERESWTRARNTVTDILKNGVYRKTLIDMATFDFKNWIEEGKTEDEKELRQAAHTLFVAIGNSPSLNSNMIVKGGFLLVMKYKSTRYTRDIDFSTPDKYEKGCGEEIKRELDKRLVLAVEELDYGLDCRVQKCKLDPNKDDATYPTLEMTVGYAGKGSREHARLIKGDSPHILKIDYSFNEPNFLENDVMNITGGGRIETYSLPDLVGEKYRAIIQQKVRNRHREQDAYDIYYLIEHEELDNDEIKAAILKSLIQKSRARVEVSKHSLDDEETKRRLKSDYDDMASSVEGELPPFETAFKTVKEYYESLPW
ncbi:MAG: nucleotidyl transferase AbiEii/AbiGii toxin family protein [bacterium]